MPRAFVVSIHDVAPSTRDAVEKILAGLLREGVRNCSLLVVPDYHRQGRSMADAGFRTWLRALEATGHEIVIHGFFHERVRRSGETTRAKFVTRIYTADEGEFFDLGYEDALGLLQTAQAEFEANGFQPAGFVAPAWLLGPAAERAVIDSGMKYTTTLRTVRDYAARRVITSQSLVYSVRSEWRRVSSLAWNRMLFRRLAPNPLLRLGVHPPDLEHSAIWEQICLLAGKALRDRIPMTYQGWLAQPATLSGTPLEIA
ncbi:MAG: polysaccharide deacetylase family protein [Spartobacteria bacterium]